MKTQPSNATSIALATAMLFRDPNDGVACVPTGVPVVEELANPPTAVVLEIPPPACPPEALRLPLLREHSRNNIRTGNRRPHGHKYRPRWNQPIPSSIVCQRHRRTNLASKLRPLDNTARSGVTARRTTRYGRRKTTSGALTDLISCGIGPAGRAERRASAVGTLECCVWTEGLLTREEVE
jgi:hypothetical protein